jgi:hypothetical protein
MSDRQSKKRSGSVTKIVFPSGFRHRTSTAEDSRLKGSALTLPAAFADINIHKAGLYITGYAASKRR